MLFLRRNFWVPSLLAIGVLWSLHAQSKEQGTATQRITLEELVTFFAKASATSLTQPVPNLIVHHGFESPYRWPLLLRQRLAEQIRHFGDHSIHVVPWHEEGLGAELGDVFKAEVKGNSSTKLVVIVEKSKLESFRHAGDYADFVILFDGEQSKEEQFLSELVFTVSRSRKDWPTGSLNLLIKEGGYSTLKFVYALAANAQYLSGLLAPDFNVQVDLNFHPQSIENSHGVMAGTQLIQDQEILGKMFPQLNVVFANHREYGADDLYFGRIANGEGFENNLFAGQPRLEDIYRRYQVGSLHLEEAKVLELGDEIRLLVDAEEQSIDFYLMYPDRLAEHVRNNLVRLDLRVNNLKFPNAQAGGRNIELNMRQRALAFSFERVKNSNIQNPDSPVGVEAILQTLNVVPNTLHKEFAKAVVRYVSPEQAVAAFSAAELLSNQRLYAAERELRNLTENGLSPSVLSAPYAQKFTGQADIPDRLRNYLVLGIDVLREQRDLLLANSLKNVAQYLKTQSRCGNHFLN